MTAQLATYLINLDDSKKRLEDATRQLIENEIAFERFSAFDGRQLDPLSRPEYDQDRAMSWFGRSLTGGELGCYFSHVQVAEKFLQSDAEFGLALEDDLTVAPKTGAILQEIVERAVTGELPQFYMANLGRPVKRFYSPINPLQSAPDSTLCKAHYFPDTTTAILWSRAGAEAFVKSAYPIYMPVDHFLRYWNSQEDGGYGLTQVPIVPSGVDSDIAWRNAPKSVTWSYTYRLKKFRRLRVNKKAAKINMSAAT